MTTTRTAIYLAGYVAGRSLSLTDFSFRQEPIRGLREGQVLLETLSISVDPYLRGCMSGHTNYYAPRFELSEPIFSVGVARVVESSSPTYRADDVVVGAIDWADYSVWSPEAVARVPSGGLEPIDSQLPKPSHALSALGLPGLTAFFGIREVARPRRSETVVMSSAAGAVGSLAGQIARRQGARVIGLASTEAKRQVLVNELGFDHALDYRSPSLADELLAIAPAGPDVYFDNVGGSLAQAIMSVMRYPARVVECGQIATYDDSDGGWTVDIRPIHRNGLSFQGFSPSIFREWHPAARAQLAHWIHTGDLVVLESEYQGLASAPTAMLDLFRGANLGKTIVKVAAS